MSGEAGVEDGAPDHPKEPSKPDPAKGTPADPELARLVAAFERGDYATVRADAPRLAKTTSSEEVRRAALDLRRRIDPDPLAAALIVAAVCLLVFLSYWYWSHPLGAPGAAP